MNFKLVIKQSFLNIASKLRLYLSLIIFLVVGFSIIAGVATYFNTFDADFSTIINTGKMENFSFDLFKFQTYNDNQSTNPDANTKDTLYSFSKEGLEDFDSYISQLTSKDGHQVDLDNNNNFINKLGQAKGDLNLVDTTNEDSSNISELMKVSKYYGNNLLAMYLSDHVLNQNGNAHIQTAIHDAFDGTDKDNQQISFSVRPLNANYDDSLPNPYLANNEVSQIHFDGRKPWFWKKVESKGLIPFYVSGNYLRYTKKSIGDDLTLSLNGTIYKGYIKDTIADKMKIFHNTDTADLYVDFRNLEKQQNFDITYPKPTSISGWYDLQTNQTPFNNPDLLKQAANKVSSLIDNKLFDFTNANNTKSEIVKAIDYESSVFAFYKSPINLYNAFVLVITIAVGILIVIIIYFIINETITSQKKILWFLKALGIKDFKLSLINSLSALVPLIISLVIAIPGTMLMMEFFTHAVTTDYSFTIPFYQLSWLTAVIYVAFLLGTMFIFTILNLILLKSGALSIENNDSMSRFQKFLAKTTGPIVKNTPGKFRVGFAFVRQNLAKNLVSFVIFTILFTVTLFGVQFNRSVDAQKNSYQQWMGDYHAISTLSPKQLMTYDQKDTTYKTISYDEFTKLQNEELDSNGDDTAVYSKEFNYDMFSYLATSIAGAKDVINKSNDYSDNDNNLVIDSKNHEVVQLPKDPSTMMEKITAALTVQLDWKDDKLQLKNPSNDVDIPIDEGQLHNWYPLLNEQLLAKLESQNRQYKSASIMQWTLRELKNISLWSVDQNYIISLEKLVDKLPSNEKTEIQNYIQQIISKVSKSEYAKNVLPTLQKLEQIYTIQKDTFNIQYPSINLNFGYIVIPQASNNLAQPLSAIGLSETYRNSQFIGYGLDPNKQPFTKPISELNQDKYAKLDTSDDSSNIDPKTGIKYETINVKFSTIARDRNNWQIGDIIPIDTSQTGLKDNNSPLAFKIAGFVPDDTTLLEAFYNKQAFYEYLNITNGLPKEENDINLDNTMYTQSDIPFFVQNITVPHMASNGEYVDNYIYKLDTFTSDHKTTAIVTKIFASMVDAYTQLMSQFIILLVILCVAISSIIITLIMFENRKTIMLFKAMGYQKREVIWYIISGYLIAVILALGISFGLTVLFVHILAPVAAVKIYLVLAFHPFWLFWVIGIFETLAFIVLIVGSIVTYTRVLKPKDAFATL